MAIFVVPIASAEVRSDPAGDGWFGASRGGRPHLGLDLCVEPGVVVGSPCAGRFVRWGRPYAKSDYRLFEIAYDGTWQARVFYVEPFNPQSITPTTVGILQPLGYAQDITKKYAGSGMLNHIHVEFRAMDQRVIPAGCRRIQKGGWWYADPAVLLGVTTVRRPE